MSADAGQRFNGALKRSAELYIQALGIITSMIADLAVTTAKIADLAVTPAKIADLAVTTVKLAANSVTRAKLGTESLEFTLRSIDTPLNASETAYYGLAGDMTSLSETTRQRAALRSGTLKRLKIRVRTNTLSQNSVITVRINGVATLMSVTVIAGVVSILTNTQDIAILENDLISVQSVTPAATGGGTIQIEIEGAYNNS